MWKSVGAAAWVAAVTFPVPAGAAEALAIAKQGYSSSKVSGNS
jgi:hypothetical protein